MNLKHALLTAGLLASAAAAHAQLVVGVSWSNFQEERWKTDEAAIKTELAKRGATYVSADAGGSPEKQLADVDGLIAKGAKALVILAMDKDAIVPALAKAKQRSIPVIAYDRLIDQPGVFYITFDNQEVGRMQARAVFSVKPTGNYVMIKGSPTDPNADFLVVEGDVVDAGLLDQAVVGDHGDAALLGLGEGGDDRVLVHRQDDQRLRALGHQAVDVGQLLLGRAAGVRAHVRGAALGQFGLDGGLVGLPAFLLEVGPADTHHHLGVGGGGAREEAGGQESVLEVHGLSPVVVCIGPPFLESAAQDYFVRCSN